MGCDPCNKPPATSKEYLMVQATGVEADPCGYLREQVSPTSACPKQEPTYDFILSGFVVPLVGSTINVNVCNVNVYSLLSYVYFPGFNLWMQIVASSTENKTLSLKNACVDGVNAVEGNPDPGQAIPINSTFVVCDAPRCDSVEEDRAELESALSNSTELCVPQFGETSNTAIVQLVGRTEADPGDSGFKKCLKRVAALFFQNGAIRQPNIETVSEASYSAYRKAGIEKTTKQMRMLPNIGEFAGVVAGKKYIMGGTTATEKPVGPALIFSPITKAYAEVGTITNDGTYTNLANGNTFSNDYSVNIPEITGLLNRDLQDHYYLELKLIVGMQAASGASHRFLKVKLNNEIIGVLSGTANGIHTFQTYIVPIKIMQVDTTFNLKLEADGNGIAYYFKLDAIGVRM